MAASADAYSTNHRQGHEASEVYLQPSRTSRAFFVKRSIVHVQLGSKYASELISNKAKRKDIGGY